MNRVRVLIADDEPVALDRLEHALACVPEAELVASARTGAQTLTLIRELKPEVVILDIAMPGLTGLDVIARLKNSEALPEVIFITAFGEHAIAAFDLHAVDYLLKPVPFERLRDALRRAKARLDAKAADERFAELQMLIETLRRTQSAAPTAAYERELWVRQKGELERLPVEFIDAIEAEGDYVMVHSGQASHLIKDTIVSLQSRLDPARFVRVSRFMLVNAERVRTLRRPGKKGLSLVLQTGVQVTVGRGYVADVLEALNARRWRR